MTTPKIWKRITFLSVLTLITNSYTAAKEIINIPLQNGEVTMNIRMAIESAKTDDIKIVLEKGTYFCKPDYATEKYCAITNHGNGSKKIIFPIKGFKKVEIEGNGATILCHGQLFPFLIEECNEVNISGITINWDIPFTFLAEVIDINRKEGWREVRPLRDGFSWKIEKNKIMFPNIDGFNYSILGSTLPFDKEKKKVVTGAQDMHSDPSKVVELPNGNLRIYEKQKYYPPIGSLLSSKGDREKDRYAPAFDFKECQNITLNNVTVHHALGMAYLFERSENIKIRGCKVVLPPNSDRVISSTADATHFANCKGDILIEGCTFENMLDDGTNVHGTYVEVNKIIDSKTIRVALKHFEQLGFKFAAPGDEVWFIKYPSPARAETNTVTKINIINETYMDLTFANAIPSDLKTGDVVENKTWNPTFTVRGCTIRNHRARNLILKTPLKTVIENNNLSSMMSAILFRGETFFWFESGAVNDVTIRNNKFKNYADCGKPHAAIYITPRLGKNFDQTECYDKNINIINNEIDGFNPRVVWADRAENLIIKGNRINLNNEEKAPFPDAPVFQLENCKNVTIEDNIHTGLKPAKVLEADKKSRETLKIKGNKNLKFE